MIWPLIGSLSFGVFVHLHYNRVPCVTPAHELLRIIFPHNFIQRNLILAPWFGRLQVNKSAAPRHIAQMTHITFVHIPSHVKQIIGTRWTQSSFVIITIILYFIFNEKCICIISTTDCERVICRYNVVFERVWLKYVLYDWVYATHLADDINNVCQ